MGNFLGYIGKAED